MDSGSGKGKRTRRDREQERREARPFARTAVRILLHPTRINFAAREAHLKPLNIASCRSIWTRPPFNCLISSHLIDTLTKSHFNLPIV